MRPIYLDYNATTPMDPRVFEAMKPYFLEEFGNAGSRTHLYGQRAKEAVETARAQVAAVLGARPEEVIFTSGATESNNLALLGLVPYGLETGRRHVLSTAIEHKAVLEPLDHMRKLGFDVELAPVTSGGYVEPDAIRQRLRADTLVVSVMHANNETGVLQPVEEIGDILAGSETLFHTDAAQTFGKEVESLRRVQVGLRFHQRAQDLRAQGRRRDWRSAKNGRAQALVAAPVWRRSGTGPPPGHVVRAADRRRWAKQPSWPAPSMQIGGSVRQAAKRSFLAALQEVEHQVNGDVQRSQAHVVNVSFRGVDSEALMLEMRDAVAISNGSACTSSEYAPSHVLKAMGLGNEAIDSSIRISWGSTVDRIPTDQFVKAVQKLRI